MIYLYKGLFRPLACFWSVLALLVSAASLCLYFVKDEIIGLVCCVVILFIHGMSLTGYYFISRTKQYWMEQRPECIAIYYPNVLKNREPLTLDYNQLVKIEYYKMTSIRAWLLLANRIYPQCVFVTYRSGDAEIRKLIGYPAYEEIAELCKKHGIPLEMR